MKPNAIIQYDGTYLTAELSKREIQKTIEGSLSWAELADNAKKKVLAEDCLIVSAEDYSDPVKKAEIDADLPLNGALVIEHKDNRLDYHSIIRGETSKPSSLNRELLVVLDRDGDVPDEILPKLKALLSPAPAR